MIRAKFCVMSITKFKGGSGKVELQPVYSQDENDENKRFWTATPSGKIEMVINTSAIDSFIVGEEYYVDFSPTALGL